ncbi:uncharacterized protein LOC143236318 [Tachypleus tridentatus]|uniref:uncharacterized protein LOC143236318 n=1 Tax=Tachypleus tridentatus TaxID=6853 RepID=UPI003FD5C1FE
MTTTTIQSPAAPQPVTARFADSLDNVLITLSDSLGPEGLVNCSDLFNQTSLELLGENPRCISIANTLTIQLGREPDLIPDDSLTFLSSNGLYNRDVTPELGLEVTGTVTVEEPINPFTPYFELFGPREVCRGTVNVTVIDVTADARHEMDYFRTIFPMDTSDPTIYYDLHNLQKIVSQEGVAGDPKRLSFQVIRDVTPELGLEVTGTVTVEEPINPLRENLEYVIIITAINRFGGESYIPSTQRVRRVTKPLALTLLGPNIVDPQHDVTYTVSVDVCRELDMMTSNLQFTWSLFPPIIDLSGFTGITATVPKGYLQHANSYNVSVEGMLTDKLINKYTIG